MNLGLNIKNLRLAKGMTQEELAEYTGVSSRAVSRWENGKTYPDISLLPILANIFEVTVDELLDVDVYKKERDIKNILEENQKYKHSGEVEKSIDLLRKSLNKYPNNFEIMKQLKNALLMYYCAKDGERSYLLDEIIELCEKILNKCSDKKIRESAIRDLVFVYPRVGEREKARKLAEQQPSMYMCKERLLEDVLEGEELDELLKGNVISITERFHGIILSMSIKKDPQMKINLMNKYLELTNLVFEDRSMGFYHERMYRSYLSNARNYAKLNQIEESIDSLLYCINHAIKLETSTITKYDQLLLDGLVDDTSKIQTNSTLSNKKFISSYIYRSDMSLVRESSRFKEVEDSLNKLK